MTANKHTKGPWHHEVTNSAHTSYVVVSADGLANGSTAVIGQCAGPDRLENARLIAAAPDLLEACQTFSEWLRREEAGFPAETRFDTPDGEARWREWYFENLRICDLAQTLARAAIAKATGGAA